MTMRELKRTTRDLTVRASVQAVKTTLDVLLTILNKPDPKAAALRAACVRSAMELLQEILQVTG